MKIKQACLVLNNAYKQVATTCNNFLRPFNADSIKLLKTPTKDIVEISSMPKQIGMGIKQTLTNTAETKQGLSIYNIPNLRRIDTNNVLSGSTLENSQTMLQHLHNNGINTIIDFRINSNPKYKKLCEHIGLNYYNLPLENSTRINNSSIFIKENGQKTKINQKFVEELKKFFELTNDGNVYMGCNYGIDRTNIGATLNYLLNTENNSAPIILTWDNKARKNVINGNIRLAKKILKALTPDQKYQLGIPENYSAEFFRKVNCILAKNRNFN